MSERTTAVDVEVVPRMLRRYAGLLKAGTIGIGDAELPIGVDMDDVVLSAAKLVEAARALDRLLWVINQDRDGDYFICREGEAEIQHGHRLIGELGLRPQAADVEVVKDTESQRIDELIVQVEQGGVTSGELDELVHDAASVLGSDANNEGIAGQIRFLVRQWGFETVASEVASLSRRPTATGG